MIGLTIFFFKAFRLKRIVLPKSLIYRLVLLLLVFGFAHLGYSLFIKTSLYYFFRNAVIVYSVFSFFIGFYLFKYLPGFLKLIRIPLALTLLGAIGSGAKLILDRFSASAFIPLIFRKANWLTIVFIAILNVIYAITFDSLTVTLIALIFVGIVTIRKYLHFKFVVIVALIGAISLFAYIAPSLSLYKTGPYRLFGNVHVVYQDNKLLQIDDNSSWRTILWYRVIVEKFPQNIVGIGIGTPLLSYKKNMDTSASEHSDEYDAHVIGVHNTYITLFARLGVSYLIITLLIYRSVFKFYYHHKNYLIKNKFIFYFWAFFAVSIIGLFNLMLESPIFASLYWVWLGVVAKVIHNYRFGIRTFYGNSKRIRI